jgi:hypothetical protein
MLGWLRTAGLTAAVGGQECVSDGCFIGRSPQTPRGSRKQQYFQRGCQATIVGVKGLVIVLLGWSQIEGGESLQATRRHGPRQTTITGIGVSNSALRFGLSRARATSRREDLGVGSVTPRVRERRPPENLSSEARKAHGHRVKQAQIQAA